MTGSRPGASTAAPAGPLLVPETDRGHPKFKEAGYRFPTDGENQAGQIRTVAGDRISGGLAGDSIGFRLSTGQELSVPVSEVVAIDFSGAGISQAEMDGCR